MTPKKKPDAKKSKPGKTPKRDWLKIKLEFFKSDYTELWPFLRDKYQIDTTRNSASARATKGWASEKIELKKIWFDRAREKVVDLYTPTAEELAQMHQTLTTLNKAALQFMVEDCFTTDKATGKKKISKMPDTAITRRIWEMVKAEKLEPTAVQKNENSMSDDDRSLLSQLLDQNYDDSDAL